MKVILLERVANLGQMGDVVRVQRRLRPQLPSAARARRSAPPRRTASGSSASKVQLEARNLEARKEAEAVAEKLDGQTYVVIRQAGETGQLYGSVATRDVADAAIAGGFTVERSQVLLDSADQDHRRASR